LIPTEARVTLSAARVLSFSKNRTETGRWYLCFFSQKSALIGLDMCLDFIDKPPPPKWFSCYYDDKLQTVTSTEEALNPYVNVLK